MPASLKFDQFVNFLVAKRDLDWNTPLSNRVPNPEPMRTTEWQINFGFEWEDLLASPDDLDSSNVLTGHIDCGVGCGGRALECRRFRAF